MNTKAIELARKLKALAEKGESGERHNAEALLRNLLKKHKLNLADIETEEVSKHHITYPRSAGPLAVQIIANVAGRIQLWGQKGKRDLIIAECTHAQFLEIRAKIDFYWPLYQREQKRLYRAFVAINDLGALASCAEPPTTAEEAAELKRIMRMAESMDRHHFQKRIEG